MDSSHASRDEVVSWLRLTLVPGVPLAAQRALLKAFVSPAAIAAAPRRDVAAASTARIAECLATGPDAGLIEKTLAWLDTSGCDLVTLDDPRYPQALLDTADPPCVLYVQGRVELLNTQAIAIVGSRNATPEGVRDAQSFARILSESGFTIVSGLALGIDAAAHRGGLAAAGSSVAVMGTGPDIIYPRRNHELAHALATQGCLVTEFPLGTRSVAGNFPRRNRLISGLARGVLVVEAGLPSGSLNTARHALEQSRDVFAIPGSIHSPLSKGCHWLIKEGAKLVESADDILVELGASVARAAAPIADAPGDDDDGDPVLAAIGYSPANLEQLAQRTGLDAAKLAAHLSALEIARRVAALPGGWFQRVKNRDIE